MRWIVFITILFSTPLYSQYKSFVIGVKGDTLNRTDNAGLKQGAWVIKTAPLRGEQGYDEEGTFKDGQKQGTWRTYSTMGDLMAIENYRFGYKNGKCSYYILYGIIREESWKAVDPAYPYDTVDVPDLTSDIVYRRVVKLEGTTVKHGTWNYYDPQTGIITKTEEYVLDKLVTGKKNMAFANLKDSTKGKGLDTLKAVAKPKEVMEYEKKNSNKKKIKVRDGATGVP